MLKLMSLSTYLQDEPTGTMTMPSIKTCSIEERDDTVGIHFVGKSFLTNIVGFNRVGLLLFSFLNIPKFINS